MQIIRTLAAFLLLMAMARAAEYQVGDRVEAQSYSSWYPAKIIETGSGKWKVTYDGYGSSSDEWLPAEKIRVQRKGSWKTGDRVEALSYGKWYGASIVDSEAARWKVTYDGYSSSSDEWMNIDHLRAPETTKAGGGSGREKPEKPKEKFSFPARPTGKKAGIEGAFLRVQSYFWSGRLSLTNEGWFFTKDGRFSSSPKGGFDFQKFSTATEASSTDGSYWIEGKKITFAWADGRKSEEQDFELKGDEFNWGGPTATRVKGFKPGWRLDGEYEGGFSLGGGALAASNTLVFHKDGTFGRSSISTFTSTSNTSTVSGGSQREASGTYEFEAHVLTLKLTDGTVVKSTVFPFSDDDAAGLPFYIYREGTMMKRQDPKK